MSLSGKIPITYKNYVTFSGNWKLNAGCLVFGALMGET
jgi:hypothetical protein